MCFISCPRSHPRNERMATMHMICEDTIIRTQDTTIRAQDTIIRAQDTIIRAHRGHDYKAV
jgi:hypothetical protein